MHVRRCEDFTFGREYSYTERVRIDCEFIPTHLSYDENISVTETFEFEALYLLMAERGRVYIYCVPESARSKAQYYGKMTLPR